jgi:hypothetical protein
MDSLPCIAEPPPWKWLTSHQVTSRDFRERRADAVTRVCKVFRFYTDNDIKLVRIVCMPLDIFVDIAIYRAMDWLTFKEHVMVILEANQKKLPFPLEKIKDIALSNYPFFKAPAIDDKVHDLFTVVPDNVTMHLVYMLVENKWLFVC